MELPSSSLPHVGGLDEGEAATVEPPLPPLFAMTTTALPIDEGPEVISNSQGEAWQLSLLVISSINIALVTAYWAYLIYASYTRTVRWRPPLAPHFLLLGLALGACAGFPHLTPALLPACQGARLTTALAYTIIYATLLVRLVCLRSLGRGVFLPSPYQALLLFFALLVQLALCLQWLVEEEEEGYGKGGQGCLNLRPYRHLLSLCYPAILFLAVLMLSTVWRNAREHYGEARNIWYAALSHLPVWIAWPSASMVLEQHYSAICGLGLQAVVLLSLLVLLLPRSRHLTYLSRDGYNKWEDPYSTYSDSSFLFGRVKHSMNWERGHNYSGWKRKPETKLEAETEYVVIEPQVKLLENKKPNNVF